MNSQNAGLWKTCLAVGGFGILFLLYGCGAPNDAASAPAETAQTIPDEQASASEKEPFTDELVGESVRASKGGLGAYGVAASGYGMGAGKGPASSSEYENLFEEIDRKLASLPLANIAFNTPETIPMGEAAVIELMVSLHETEEKLRQAIRAAGPVETARVKVSPLLEASLAGPGFNIELVTPQQQLLSSTQRTQWRWNIEPTKSEFLELTLTLSAHLTVDGQQSTRAIQTFERTIAVDVPISYRVSHFVSANQQWLITVLILPIIGWFYRRYTTRQPVSQTPPNDQSTVSRAA